MVVCCWVHRCCTFFHRDRNFLFVSSSFLSNQFTVLLCWIPQNPACNKVWQLSGQNISMAEPECSVNSMKLLNGFTVCINCTCHIMFILFSRMNHGSWRKNNVYKTNRFAALFDVYFAICGCHLEVPMTSAQVLQQKSKSSKRQRAK